MVKKMRTALQEFIALESSAGIILFGAALLAMVAINSMFSPYYLGFLDIPVAVQFGGLEIAKPLALWINDGLMAIFFFLIGLEVKRELLEGQLSTIEQASLPAIAAIGGMAIPALIFVYFNWNMPENFNGWAIPAATDIAFALGVLALLGKHAPVSLKILLLAIAIIDDIGAILIIALFYTSEVSGVSLLLAGGGTILLFVMNRLGVIRTAPYILVGIFLWICVLKSGVHATLAGVIAALAIPLNAKDGSSPLKHLEHILHPWAAFLILPLFAFANAGVSLAGLRLDDLAAPLALGVAAGLVVGKQIGVFGFIFLATRIGLVKRPDGVSWFQLYGLACLTGIGFTMSLFIGNLAFAEPEQIETVKLGVMSGSLVSGLLGFCFLRWAPMTSPVRPA
ncbi:Na+/H+ antiporter NhaA [Parasphingorhabdus flavimaris]|jgi:Na+:H+ antiporter, NhaA family|uniref:Na(+)/H(+) antiporter NhaA n=2 Tax=Parasphingorhabdus flavimaris TaxID=266812 RepID=A0ABX2N6G8_9SPHN|nr:Na+/H+ antiporter NhaA [Parasphingorhabdus flavimaris]|tara:strand:- start:7158 stop:8342 length:1185 start_codon:yes stop_codon:yes gene_type:complete